MGKARVDATRLSKSLEEVAWVFPSLCANLPQATVEGPLRAWDGAACAQAFAVNIGLPQVIASGGFRLLPIASGGFRWLPIASDCF